MVVHLSPFLPQDNAETPESESVVSANAEGLSILLKYQAPEFWTEVKTNKSLIVCLSTYLQFSRRRHDYDRSFTAPSQARLELAKNTFLVLYRLITVDVSAIARANQAQWLQKSGVFSVPKLFDIAVLYGQTNVELLRKFMRQVFALQPQLTSELQQALPLIADNLRDVEATCHDTIGRLHATASDVALQGIADGLAYLHDSCATLSALASVYPPLAVTQLSTAPEILGTLARVSTRIIPSAVSIWAKLRQEPARDQLASQVQARLMGLSKAVPRLLFLLVSRACLLQSEVEEDSFPRASSSRSASLDAEGRGLRLLEVLQSLDALDGSHSTAKLVSEGGNFADLCFEALQSGYIALDEGQQQRLEELLACSPQKFSAAARTAGQASSSNASWEAEREDLLRQIHEVLPGYGNGFLLACLDSCGYSAERVIAHLLEGNLPSELKELDPEMQTAEPRRTSAAASGPSGRAWAESEQQQREAYQAKVAAGPKLAAKQAQANVHKGTARAMASTEQERAMAKLHAQAAQWEEYEDEYDDSFDDLADYNADASAGTETDAMPGQPTLQPHQQPKGGKPLWVLNGRVYNYRKEGATPVPNQAAAEEVAAAQKAEKDTIQGLGPGGNYPKEGRADDRQNGHTSNPTLSGSGNQNSRPPDLRQHGNRRTHAFKDAHKAAIGNHHRKDRALRKMGGPAG